MNFDFWNKEEAESEESHNERKAKFVSIFEQTPLVRLFYGKFEPKDKFTFWPNTVIPLTTDKLGTVIDVYFSAN